MNRLWSVLILGYFFLSCAGKEGFAITTEASGTKIITGAVVRTLLEDDSSFTWFKSGYTAYVPDSSIIKTLRTYTSDVQFILFFGSWCGDSKREIPKLLKIFDALNIGSEKIVLYGLDRTKKSKDGFSEKYNIKNVPTLIVISEGKEIGRIVENPVTTNEKELLKILKK